MITLTHLCIGLLFIILISIPAAFLLFFILIALFAPELIYDFFEPNFHKNNPNRYLYKLLKKYSAETSFEMFLLNFANDFWPYSETIFNPLYEKQKNICFDAFRFTIGLMATNTFDKEKSLDIIQEILCMLAIDKENSPNENFYEKENIIINNYQLLKATQDDNDVLEYVFLNKNSNKLLTVAIDISNCDTCDEDDNVYDTTDILTEKFRFLVE